MPPAPGPDVVVPLRAFRIAPRKPYLTVGAADLSAGHAPPADVPVYAEPVVVPYLYPSNGTVPPNVVLVFREPLRAPRVRRAGRIGAGIGCAGVAVAISGLSLGDAWGRAGTVAALCGFGLHQAAGYAAIRHWIRHRGVGGS